MAKRRKKRQQLYTREEKLIIALDKLRFDDQEEESARLSLCRQWVKKGQLTRKQWWYVRELLGRQRRIEKIRVRSANIGWYVYAIGDSSRIKIGHSKVPQKRLQALQTGYPYKLSILAQVRCDDRQSAKNLEKKLHRKCKKYHMRGEWFQREALPIFLL